MKIMIVYILNYTFYIRSDFLQRMQAALIVTDNIVMHKC